MLLHLQNTDESNIKMLFDFAEQHHLKLSFVDESATNLALPGKPFSDIQLKSIIDKSRNSGSISMKDAHDAIRKKLGGN